MHSGIRIGVALVVLGLGVLTNAYAQKGMQGSDVVGPGGNPAPHLSRAAADAIVHGHAVRGITPMPDRLSGSQIRCYDNSLAPTACSRARDCSLPRYITGAICP